MSARPEVAEIPDWQLERYALGELPADEMRQLAARLETDPALAQRLAALAADSAALLAAHPPRVVGSAIRERLAEPVRRQTAWRPALAFAAPALAAAIALGFWLHTPVGVSEGPAAPESTRIKGTGPGLLLFRQANGGVQALTSGARARPGDLVQLAYRAAGARYGAIVSVDGRGVVTPHMPTAGTKAVPLRSGGAVTLDAAYRLDDAPRFEVFYFVTSREEFDLAMVRAAAGVSARADTQPETLALPAGLDQAAFLLRKDVTR